jgi:hypothetical protein
MISHRGRHSITRGAANRGRPLVPHIARRAAVGAVRVTHGVVQQIKPWRRELSGSHIDPQVRSQRAGRNGLRASRGDGVMGHREVPCNLVDLDLALVEEKPRPNPRNRPHDPSPTPAANQSRTPIRLDGEPSDEVTAIPRMPALDGLPQGGTCREFAWLPMPSGTEPTAPRSHLLGESAPPESEAALVPASLATYQARTGQTGLHRWPPT